MAHYVKIFDSILRSTIWLEDSDTRIVWCTLLVLADCDGMVRSSVPGLALAARVSRSACEQALLKFSAPDADSTNSDFEGRRIRKVEGGWELLNFSKYIHLMNPEDIKEKTKIRVQKWRSRNKSSKLVTPVTPVTFCNAGNDTIEEKRREEKLTLSPPGDVSKPKINPKEKTNSDPRFKECVDALASGYTRHGWSFAFNGKDGENLKRLLSDRKAMTVLEFRKWLKNYFDSDGVVPGGLPSTYLTKLPQYWAGPLNQYGKLLEGRSGNSSEVLEV